MVTPAPAPTAPPTPSLSDRSPDGSSGRWNWRPWIFPGVLALLVGQFALLTPFVYMVDMPRGLWGGHLATTPLIVPVLVAGNVSAVAGVLLARRSRALACALATWPFLVTPVVATFVWAWWLALLAIAVVSAFDAWRRAVPPFLLAMAIAAGYCATGIYAMLPVGPVTPGSDPRIIFVLYVVYSVAVLATSAAIGASRRARRRAAAADRASEQAHEIETIAVERARIAHDLHDVVAHHVSLVAVRAESAPYAHPSMDDDAKAVLADIADDARRALGELRQVLTVLQRTDGADRAPQPGARDVEALVDAARGAGQDVTIDGDVPHLPSAAGLVLYRAVQESLTNARRHAPGRPVTLTLRTGAAPSGLRDATEPDASMRPDGPDDGLRASARRAVTARLSNPLVPRTSPAAPGRGLLGMRERVESIGGTLTAGEENSSFVVELTLPVDEPEPARPAERAEPPLRYSTGDPLDVHLLNVPDGSDA